MNAYLKQTAPHNRIRGQDRRIDPRYDADSRHLNIERNPSIGELPRRYLVINKLENCVSTLQIVRANMERIIGWLQEMKDFLDMEVSFSPHSTIPGSVINNFLKDRLKKIDWICNNTGFQGKLLLNGDCGVKGSAEGKNLSFMRGSARVISSFNSGYPVSVSREACASTLVGIDQVTPKILRMESMIAVNDGLREVRYRLKENESAASLVTNLQNCMLDHGLDISVYRTGNNCLFFRYNQLGTGPSFQGMSYKTRLVSHLPGQFRHAAPGRDIVGTIGSELTEGKGGFLIGKKGNRRTDGLIVFYDGKVEYIGQIVGYVKVLQNGLHIPLDLEEKKEEILILPTLSPKLQAVGVINYSGFENLNAVRVRNEKERIDSLKLIIWSLTELDYLMRELKEKETGYVNLAIEMLKNKMVPKIADEDMLIRSKGKALQMAEQLKHMLRPK